MAEIEIGSVVGGYRIDGVIGEGGMGVVYRATQLGLDRTVALKFITPALANDASFRERFERESRLAASINHPNVVPVHEAGEADGLLYIALAYVEGRDLRALIEDSGRLDPSRAGRIIEQVASALDAAHQRGLVHRDVKPGNVLVTGQAPHEHAYLTDFGLTKQISSGGTLTKTGQWVGTLDYVAPEQIEGRALDARTDVYALGCVLHQALTGQVPYVRNSDVAKMYAHMNDPPPPVTEMVPGAPRELDAVVARAMAKDPDARYPSTGDFGRAAVAAAAGGSLALPERSVATGEAAPAGATRVSAGGAQPDPGGAEPDRRSGEHRTDGSGEHRTRPSPQETVRSPGPEPDTMALPASQPRSPVAPTPVAAAPAPAAAAPPRKPNRGLIAAIVAAVVLLLAGGATAAVLGGVFEGDESGSKVADTDTESATDSESETASESDTERAPAPETDTDRVAAGPCENSFIPAGERAELSDSVGSSGQAVEGSVFYGQCDGETWALASFPDGLDGAFRRVGDGWQLLGPIDSGRCMVPAGLLEIWRQPPC